MDAGNFRFFFLILNDMSMMSSLIVRSLFYMFTIFLSGMVFYLNQRSDVVLSLEDIGQLR